MQTEAGSSTGLTQFGLAPSRATLPASLTGPGPTPAPGATPKATPAPAFAPVLAPVLASMLATIVTLAFIALPAAAAESADSATTAATVRTTTGGATWLSFDAGLLSDIDIAIRDVDAPARDDRGRWRFAVRAGGIDFEVRTGAFEDIVKGTVRHTGGFTLDLDQTAIAVREFRIRPGPEVRTLELLTANGEVVFSADHMHVAIDRAANELRMYNLDLRIAPALADKLGRPDLRGLAVGTLDIETSYRGTIEDNAGGDICTTPNWFEPDVRVDVSLTGINSVQQNGSAQDGALIMTPSASLQNVGTADVAWWEKFSDAQDPYGVSQHPFLVWALYRVADGRIEQIGRSAVKHAFFSINSGCSCAGGGVLWSAQNAGGNGCGDTYSASTNNDTFNLGPRDEIQASPALFEECGSHFDPGCTGAQTHSGSHDPFEHKMRVLESDLETPDASYYFHAWYVVRDDIDIFNTMGHRAVTPTAPNFPFEGDLTAGSGLDAWVDPAAPLPGEANETVDTGEGHLQLAVKTTDIGRGQWRYEYALVNHDFDRQVDSFHIPLPPGGTVTAATFGDLDEDPANNWQPTGVPGGITWQAPAGNALDWGTLFNFGLTTSAAPVPGFAELGAATASADASAEMGADTVAVSTLAPHAGNPPVLCDIATNPGPYANGQQITLDSLRFVNASGTSFPARLRLQLLFDPTVTVDIIDLGAGGGFTLPDNADLQLAPRPLLVVHANMPRGNWSLRCAVEDPVTGDLLAEDFASITLE